MKVTPSALDLDVQNKALQKNRIKPYLGSGVI